MGKYEDLFTTAAAENRVFDDKGALDPLSEPESIVQRETQENKLASILTGVENGYLPSTVSIYGPPGSGKTVTVRRVCQEFAERNEAFGYEYVNLKECRTLFAVANEIHFELAGSKKDSYEGLDGVFEGIWTTLERYPDWTVLILDEIDHIQHDRNYDPNEFFYRLLRGEGRRKRGLNLSAWLISNQLLTVDLRLDSRVKSVMSDETVRFPHYETAELETILEPRLNRAFIDDAISEDVLEYGAQKAADRWGDVRKAITLFRLAGETANERGMMELTEKCIDANIETAEREEVVETLTELPNNQFLVLLAAIDPTETTNMNNEEPVTVSVIYERLNGDWITPDYRLEKRAIREIVNELETLGLIESWIESRGRDGRIKFVQLKFDSDWAMMASRSRGFLETMQNTEED